MRSFYGRIMALVFALGFVSPPRRRPMPGLTRTRSPAFTEGSLSDTGDAIDKVAASGNPLAAQVLAGACRTRG